MHLCYIDDPPSAGLINQPGQLTNTHTPILEGPHTPACTRNPETMWDPSLPADVTKLLCSHGGRLEKNRLADFLSLTTEEIEQFLQVKSQRFPQSSQFVLACSPLRICNQYLYPDPEECTGDCSKLHLCRNYLTGQRHPNPRYRCKFSHNVLSDHNCAVLKANELSGLNEDEIKVLLFQNDNQLLPQDCKNYVHDTCDEEEDCTRLHMCRYFTGGRCYTRFCKKSHNLLESKVMLSCQWMSKETIENFQMLYDLKHDERHEEPRRVAIKGEAKEVRRRSRSRARGRSRRRDDSQDSDGKSRERKKEVLVSPERTPEICLSYIWKFCKLGDKCSDMHYHLPYRWQAFNGTDWTDLPTMEDIEMAYSDPNNGSYRSVDFQTMKIGDIQVRRLSTTSSVTQPAEYVLTTEWIWYWKDTFGIWTKYGHPNTKNVNSSIVSSDLETIYLSKPNGTIPFTAGDQRYNVHCQEMRQRNVSCKTEKEVRRRPKFQDFEKVKKLKARCVTSVADDSNQTPSNCLVSTLNFPAQWDKNALPEIGYEKVLVADCLAEFSAIAQMFSKTISGYTVKKLWRIQNPTLWQVYQWQKDQMKKKNSGVDVVEHQLFHGTDSANTDAICRNNFDWRVCGTNGVLYGQGSYFSRDASYSHNYAPPTPEGTQTMFVARVLVGDFTIGDSKMKRPPQKNSTESYDSCVNAMHNPSVFVVFEKFQIYPEYILEYGKESPSPSCSIS